MYKQEHQFKQIGYWKTRGYQSIPSSNDEIIGLSSNLKFMAIKIATGFYLIQMDGETLLHIRANYGENCCFSDDSKLALIFIYFDKHSLIMLYDLEKRKKIWVRKFLFIIRNLYFNFYSNEVICSCQTSAFSIDLFNGDYKIFFEVSTNDYHRSIFEDSSFQTKINDQFFFHTFESVLNKTTKTLLFYAKTKKLCRTIFFNYGRIQIHVVSPMIVLIVPHNKKYYVLRENFKGKILRKFKNSKFLFRQNKDETFKHRILKNSALYILKSYDRYDYQVKLNISTGRQTEKFFKSTIEYDLSTYLYENNQISLMEKVLRFSNI